MQMTSQPPDPTLTALAAMAWSSGIVVPSLTAADTITLIGVGTSADQLVRLNGSAQLPAVDGSLLTGLTVSQLSDASANGRSLVAAANYATMRGLLDLEVGTDVQAYDADLTAIAGLADPNADRILFWDDSAGAYTFLTAGSGLTITGTTITASGGSSGNSFETIIFQNGGTGESSIVADSSTDTLTHNGARGIAYSANASTDTITANAYGVHQVRNTGNSNAYLGPMVSGGTTMVVAANRKYTVPFFVDRRQTFTSVAVVCSTGAASTNVRLAVYNLNQDTMEVTTLIIDCGTVDTSTSGTKTISGLSFTLNPGMYAAAIHANGVPTLRAASTTGAHPTYGFELTGTTCVPLTHGRRDTAYAASSADDTGLAYVIDGSSSFPIMGIKP